MSQSSLIAGLTLIFVAAVIAYVVVTVREKRAERWRRVAQMEARRVSRLEEMATTSANVADVVEAEELARLQALDDELTAMPVEEFEDEGEVEGEGDGWVYAGDNLGAGFEVADAPEADWYLEAAPDLAPEPESETAAAMNALHEMWAAAEDRHRTEVEDLENKLVEAYAQYDRLVDDNDREIQRLLEEIESLKAIGEAMGKTMSVAYVDPMFSALQGAAKPLTGPVLAAMAGISHESSEFHRRMMDGISWGVIRALRVEGKATVYYLPEMGVPQPVGAGPARPAIEAKVRTVGVDDTFRLGREDGDLLAKALETVR